MKTIESPVLLITYNRPDTTIKVFEKIKQAKIKKLYIFNDAPRNNNRECQKAREDIRAITKMVDWECELKRWFPESNMGCGMGVSSAISWVLENEDRVIVLEDDCVPAIAFFSYCESLLEKYKNDNRIWKINGNNYNEECSAGPYDYFFSNYGHCWGWATWKRSWSGFDLYMKNFPQFDKENRYIDCFTEATEVKYFKKKYTKLFNKVSNGEIPKQWSAQFNFYIHSQGGLNITPNKNLVKNIGFDGVHTTCKLDSHDRKIDENYEIKRHPEFILISRTWDLYHFKNHINKQGIKSIVKKMLKKILAIHNN